MMIFNSLSLSARANLAHIQVWDRDERHAYRSDIVQEIASHFKPFKELTHLGEFATFDETTKDVAAEGDSSLQNNMRASVVSSTYSGVIISYFYTAPSKRAMRIV